MTIGEKLLSVVTSIANCLKNHDGRIGALEDGGSIDTSEFVQKADYATASVAGLVKSSPTYGIYIGVGGMMMLHGASEADIDSRYTTRALVPSKLDYAVKVGLTTNTETLTAEEQMAAMKWLGIIDMLNYAFVFFTVDGVEYKAKLGMTWQDLIASEYNPTTNIAAGHSFHESQEGEVYYWGGDGQTDTNVYVTYGGAHVKATDYIIPNCAYTAG